MRQPWTVLIETNLSVNPGLVCCFPLYPAAPRKRSLPRQRSTARSNQTYACGKPPAPAYPACKSILPALARHVHFRCNTSSLSPAMTLALPTEYRSGTLSRCLSAAHTRRLSFAHCTLHTALWHRHTMLGYFCLPSISTSPAPITCQLHSPSSAHIACLVHYFMLRCG